MNLTELQDAFVRLSQQNMELASDLETERLRVAQLKTHSPSPVQEGNLTPPLEGHSLTTPIEDMPTEESDQQALELQRKLEVRSSPNLLVFSIYVA